jgi:hypothetical protein
VGKLSDCVSDDLDMPRRRRVIVKDYPYEVVPRARDTLPLPPNRTTNTVRLGIFSRAQRDGKVTLCNLVCMNNHDHMQLIPKNPKDLPRFYGEVLKKTTDSLRTLTGKKSLRIWEDRVSVIMLASLEDAIKRLVYLFCNPAKAALCDSIDSYQGISSWKAFCTCEPKLEAKYEISAPWHRVADLPKIGPRALSKTEDDRYAGRLCSSKNSVKQTLIFEPFVWLKLFGVTDSNDIEKVRQRVIREVYEREATYRAERKTLASPQYSPYLAPHTPKKKERKIFLICSDKEERIGWIEFFEQIEENCSDCYQRAKCDNLANWPPGTFIPWLPPTECFDCT